VEDASCDAPSQRSQLLIKRRWEGARRVWMSTVDVTSSTRDSASTSVSENDSSETKWKYLWNIRWLHWRCLLNMFVEHGDVCWTSDGCTARVFILDQVGRPRRHLCSIVTNFVCFLFVYYTLLMELPPCTVTGLCRYTWHSKTFKSTT